eukprot:CAMPEP_0204918280 /NCGR_PEP_ID=MMETSP1397-20131031/16050_1 /ASSEMBLY_ACC=CAM_ASM_000891 /TAXON_ID=49980 /ORGANISM="Climacostomum Climacostomum virens, Strain Stock W-24" /LENGTH=103 /DNA_ID=CAMNT_0052091529 /DNA_START=174 /DNA_END=483 /DNA_ORIENTATION=-
MQLLELSLLTALEVGFFPSEVVVKEVLARRSWFRASPCCDAFEGCSGDKNEDDLECSYSYMQEGAFEYDGEQPSKGNHARVEDVSERSHDMLQWPTSPSRLVN